jgi:DNA invertase Pin-like site-specific DNA recombinase
MTRERAGRWIRVSGDSQSEADQLPDIDAYCDTRGLVKGKIYEVHGKSAFKGAQDPAWQEVVRDIQDGIIDVIVPWMVDRMDRQTILHAIPMALAVLDAGGRIEFSEQPECNLDAKSPTIADEVKAFSDRIHAAHQESVVKSKRVRKAFRKRRENGSALNRPSWGYEITCTVCDAPPVSPGCRPHRKIFRPTSDGHTYIPAIFQMAVDGVTLREICERLDVLGVRTEKGGRWNEGVIVRIIRNPIYYGQRRNGGNLVTEPLVSYSTWQAAGAALTARARPGRGTVAAPKALLAAVCGNPFCDATGREQGDSPMYRILSGKYRKECYRCAGRGAQRKGCGNMIPCADLDARVTEAMLADHMNMRRVRVFVPGDNRADEIGKIREAAMNAYRAGDKARFAELDAEADTLAALPSVAAHWETSDTDQSEGDYFAALDLDGRRAELAANWQISASNDDGGVTVTIGRR